MKYIIMCGGKYRQREIPKHLSKIKGETLIERTIRLLEEYGVKHTDIYLSTNNEMIQEYNALRTLLLTILVHDNKFDVEDTKLLGGMWIDGFYLTDEPVCYIFGDVVFSPEAIKTIVDTPCKDIEFFASAPPFDKRYTKLWAEPFAFKVVNNTHFNECIEKVRTIDEQRGFKRHPIAWELWQVIKDTPLNEIDYTNYVAINDYTCDIDSKEDVEKIEVYVDD